MSKEINSRSFFGQRKDHVSNINPDDVFGDNNQMDVSHIIGKPEEEKNKPKIGFDFHDYMIRQLETEKVKQISQSLPKYQSNANLDDSSAPLHLRDKYQPTKIVGDNVSISSLSRKQEKRSHKETVSLKKDIINLYFGKMNLARIGLTIGTIWAVLYGYDAASDFFQKHFSPPPVQEFNMDRTIKAPQYQIDKVKDLSTNDMNDILFYMDYRAADAVNQAAEHWHVLDYAVKAGKISKAEALPFLEKTKNIHENFISNIQKDKDLMALFYQKSRDPARENTLFRISNPQAEIAAKILALGKDGEKNPILKDAANYKTDFEIFKEWKHRRDNNRYYFPQEIHDVKKMIQDKLGHNYYKDALFYAHMEIAAGVKPVFNSIVFDSAANLREVTTEAKSSTKPKP